MNQQQKDLITALRYEAYALQGHGNLPANELIKKFNIWKQDVLGSGHEGTCQGQDFPCDRCALVEILTLVDQDIKFLESLE